MRTSLLVSLLVFSTLLLEAQGIRLGKVTALSAGHRENKKEGSLIKEISNDGGLAKTVVCKLGDCNSGMNRKLMTKTTSSSSSTTTTSKNHKNDGNKDDPISSSEGIVGKEENFSVSSSPEPKHAHREVTPKRYPDVVDIAGMDYSPARKKPPIHN